MNRALYASATGMAAQQQNLDTIASNLANADVPGFRAAANSFASIGNGSLGTASLGTHLLTTPGKLMKSGGPFDIAIDGAGFFRVEREGRHGFTRAGGFTRRADGTLENGEGWRLEGVRIPADAVAVSVAADGRVSVDRPRHLSQSAGRIVLATFDAPERLRVVSSAVFAATEGSGQPRVLAAGGDRQPKIAFGMLEKSNVSIIESMMAILAAQRAYEANAKGVQAADELLRIANNLHRS